MTRIFSRKEIEWECLKEKIPSDIAIISIRNHDDKGRLLIDSLQNDKLILHFDDLLDGEESEGILPQVEHILQVAEFVEKHKNENIWVHCNGGISRSSATALMVEFLKHGDASKCVELLHVEEHFPNIRIVRIFCELVKDDQLLIEVRKFIDKAVKFKMDELI